jgi:hypothetical protein
MRLEATESEGEYKVFVFDLTVDADADECVASALPITPPLVYNGITEIRDYR